jgi:hypothetical protein
MSLVTLAQIKDALKAEGTTAPQDAELIRHGVYVTKRWRDTVKMDFEPWKGEKKITPNERNLSSNSKTLRLPAPLLAATTITIGGSALAYGTDVVSFQMDTSKPIGYLELANTYCCDWYPCGGSSAYNSIVIDGWWGYRTNYAEEGWVDTLTTLAAEITDTTTKTFTVADIDGLDNLYRSPSISAGAWAKIDDELFLIQNTNTGTNIATALRGQRGTTATTHLINAKVYTWNPEPDVVDMLAKAAAFQFASKGAFDEATITDVGLVTRPIDMPRKFYSVAQEYVNGY